MRTKEEILTDAAVLTAEIAAFQAHTRQTEIDRIANRLKAVSEQMQHDQRAADFLRFKASEAYVNGLKTDIEQNGTEATTATGEKISVQFATGTNTAKTFAVLVPGSTIEIKNHPYLVQEFDHCHAGSTATLLHLGIKAQIEGVRPTPYSGFDCHFDRATKTLTVSNRNRLTKDQTLTISGTKYQPVAVIPSTSCARYELREVSE